MSKAPLISVVIPTFGRPRYLARALESALAFASPTSSDMQVIVVPNGPDTTWRAIAAAHVDNPRIQWSPIGLGNGNAARNHGMNLAKGKYLRFLDDDDYLLPAASSQLEEIQSSGIECSSGNVENIDMKGNITPPTTTIDTDDFVVAFSQVSRMTLPAGNLFLKSSLSGMSWRPDVRRLQDNIWMQDLARAKEWKWARFPQAVAVWFQHDLPRVSSACPHLSLPTQAIDSLELLAKTLEESGRLSQGRREAIARALWNYVHSYFPYQPIYWSKVGTRARKILRTAAPDHPIFKAFPFNAIPPLASEWALFPARRASRLTKALRRRTSELDYRRRL